MRKVAFLLAAACLFSACSDDKASSKGDAGAKGDGGMIGKIPRMDAAVGGDDVLPPCDRFDPQACSDGKVCNELLRAQTDGTVVIYAGCVDAPRMRSKGDVCEQWSIKYTAEGLTDEVVLDPCGDGTICEPDPETRGAFTCQVACQTGAFGDSQMLCPNASQFCFGSGQYEEVCNESDGCDPYAQKGCPANKACYIQPNDTATGAQSVCLTPPPKGSEVPDQKPCQYVNDCAPGSSCFGPAGVSPLQWTSTDFLCRPLCSGPTSGDDAGTADDGGAGCSCVAFKGTGLDFSQIPSKPYGQCEL